MSGGDYNDHSEAEFRAELAVYRAAQPKGDTLSASTGKTAYCYDTEFLDDGKTIELISIGIVCEDGREYYAVNSDMPEDRIRKHSWLMDNVWPSLPLRGYTEKLKTVGNGRNEMRPDSYGVLDRTSVFLKPKWVIANEVRDFLIATVTPAGGHNGQPFYFNVNHPELWANYGAYDHVVLAQLWGPMIKLPEGIPMWTHDLQQAIEAAPEGFETPIQQSGHHNALEDARHNMRVLTTLQQAAR